MKAPQTLAEFLGTAASPVDADAAASLPVDPERLTAKAFAAGILHSAEYRDSIRRRVLLDELPPALECLLYHYAYGKPTESVEVKDTTPAPDGITLDQLKLRVASLQRIIRALEDPVFEAPSDTDAMGSVH